MLVNVEIVGVTMIIELSPSGGSHGATPMPYDNMDLLRPGRQAALLADVAERTGLDVVRVQIRRIYLLRDAAEITVVYRGARA